MNEQTKIELRLHIRSSYITDLYKCGVILSALLYAIYATDKTGKFVKQCACKLQRVSESFKYSRLTNQFRITLLAPVRCQAITYRDDDLALPLGNDALPGNMTYLYVYVCLVLRTFSMDENFEDRITHYVTPYTYLHIS